MSSTTFVLTSVPNPTSLPPAPSLSLLPFSLGPNSAPYTSKDAPIGVYFCPRPVAPPDAKDEVVKQDDSSEGGSAGASSTNPSHPNTTATFRGRAVVGQHLPLPVGYRGLILSAAQRPDCGGNEVYAPAPATSTSTSTPVPSTTTGSRTRTRNGLPTPAPSSASIASTQIDDDDDGIRRSPRKPSVLARIKGAGQAALAKPRRRAAPVVRKRYRLASESEDEEYKQAVADEEGTSSSAAGLARTPSKRARTALATPRKGTGAGKEGVPEIVIQEATPLKQPLATPRKRLGGVGAGSPIPEAFAEETAGDVEMASAEPSALAEPTQTSTPLSTSQVQLSDEPSPTPANEETSVEIQEVQDTDSSGQDTPALEMSASSSEEKIIPSPATEDDPPVFNVPPPPTHAPADEDEDVSAPAGASTSEGALAAAPPVESEALPPVLEAAPAPAPEQAQVTEAETSPEDEITGLIRELHPTASFSGFTLYTPDAPLAGFRADEGVAAVGKPEVKENVEAGGEGEKPEVEAEKAGEAADEGIQVRQSWWRTGGGGEGGDEMVRALGEWLGLVESLNNPVYLEGLDDSDDDE